MPAAHPGRVIVTGSIATDHLMHFPGRFADAILADQLDRLSVSFLVDDLQVRYGGVGANIAYGLGLLGARPVLVGAVGDDFDGYRAWLEESGVDTTHVQVSAQRRTPRFVCTTDDDNNQIASFYAGAMAEADHIDLGAVLGGVTASEPVPLVLIGADDPAAMLRHTTVCREQGVTFAADPSQQMARMAAEELPPLIDGAAYLFCNDYEWGLFRHKTGLSHDEVLGRVGAWVVTHGAKGCVIHRRGAADISVPPAPEQRSVDPTGVGDAFRAGFVRAMTLGLSDEQAAKVGSQLATYALEAVGTQDYSVTLPDFLARLASSYPDGVADAFAAALGG